MKPSEVMSRPDFEFQIIGEGPERKYRPFDACVKAVLPSASAETIPLTNQCPLFVGSTGDHLPTAIVDAELPQGAKLPRTPGIYFLSQAIDAMAYGPLRMPKEKIIEIIKRIEKRFVSAGLDEQGRVKK